MNFTKILTATLLVSLSACGSQSGSNTQDAPAVTEKQALTTAPTQPTAARSMHPHDAALAALPTLHELVASGTPHRRGFRSVEEAKSATLADSLPMYMIGLSDLTAFRPGQNVRALLMDMQEQMFPLAVDGDVRTSVIVRKRTGDIWEATQFVHGPVGKAVHDSRANVSKARGIDATKLILIEIPALTTRLLGYDENGTLMVTPVYDVPGTSLHADGSYKASDVFALLQPLAAQVDPNVPN